ncbi:MAG: hypothetical protein FK732_09765 [Asgard group archaeon]|nr:hypothetical protein [Asgard group archaeon]
MNSWSAIGTIFLVIGLILLMVGFVQGTIAIDAIDQTFGQFLGEYADQLRGPVFWEAGGSLIVASLVCFVVGGVGIYAGTTTEKKNEELSILPTPGPKVNYASQIKCGSCGTMNDLDAEFCKKCGNKFR